MSNMLIIRKLQNQNEVSPHTNQDGHYLKKNMFTIAKKQKQRHIHQQINGRTKLLPLHIQKMELFSLEGNPYTCHICLQQS